MQRLPGEQSAFELHSVLHVIASQTYAPHDMLLAVPHMPEPLQTRAGVYVWPLHDWTTQVMPEAHLRQAPAPSHSPSFPQVDVASCMHSLSGSVPPVTGRQRPFAWPVFAFAHAIQPAPHAVSQQTPSAQKPLAQSAAVVQEAPFAAASAPASIAPPVPAALVPAAPVVPAAPPPVPA